MPSYLCSITIVAGRMSRELGVFCRCWQFFAVALIVSFTGRHIESSCRSRLAWREHHASGSTCAQNIYEFLNNLLLASIRPNLAGSFNGIQLPMSLPEIRGFREQFLLDECDQLPFHVRGRNVRQSSPCSSLGCLPLSILG
jgi:hypothetical protein